MRLTLALLALAAPRASGLVSLTPTLTRPAIIGRNAQPRFRMVAASVELTETPMEGVPEAAAPKPALSKSALLTVMAFTAGAADTVCFTKWGSYANMSERARLSRSQAAPAVLIGNTARRAVRNCTDRLPCAFALAVTGNTISLGAYLGELRWLDATYFGAVLLTYIAGIAAYRVIDLRRRRRFTLTAAAPVVFALFAMTDLLLVHYTGSRWAMLLLATGFGLVNAASSESAGAITCMVTGHLQKMSNQLVDFVRTGSVGSLQSASILSTFAAGVAAATAFARFSPAPLRRLPPFACMGTVYAVSFVLSEWPLLGWWRTLLTLCRGGGADEGVDAESDACELDRYETECQRK